jgi:hypothetical protein
MYVLGVYSICVLAVVFLFSLVSRVAKMGLPPIHRRHAGGNAESYNDSTHTFAKAFDIMNDDITCDILDQEGIQCPERAFFLAALLWLAGLRL